MAETTDNGTRWIDLPLEVRSLIFQRLFEDVVLTFGGLCLARSQALKNDWVTSTLVLLSDSRKWQEETRSGTFKEIFTRNEVVHAILSSATMRITSEDGIDALESALNEEQKEMSKTFYITSPHLMDQLGVRLGNYSIYIPRRPDVKLAEPFIYQRIPKGQTAFLSFNESSDTPLQTTFLCAPHTFSLVSAYNTVQLSRIEIETLILHALTKDTTGITAESNGSHRERTTLGKVVDRANFHRRYLSFALKLIWVEWSSMKTIGSYDATFSTRDWSIRMYLGSTTIVLPQRMSLICWELGVMDIKTMPVQNTLVRYWTPVLHKEDGIDDNRWICHYVSDWFEI